MICLCIEFNCYAVIPQISACECFMNGLYAYNAKYKTAWIGTHAKGSQGYPYYLMSASIKSKIINNPSYYFEYYHNLNASNDSLINYLNYKDNESQKFPILGKDIASLKIEILDAIESNHKVDECVRERVRLIYKKCYQHHLNPMTFYDNSFLEFLEGNVDKSAQLAEKYILINKEQNVDHQSTPAELMLLGQSYIELNQHFEAIKVLSELIQKDPSNKEAYFHRSAAYFETGNFDEALLDFTLSAPGKPIIVSTENVSNEFTKALIASVCQGAGEAAVDFVPSLCGTAYGLGKTLWVTAQHPIESTKNFANSCYEMGKCVANYCKTIDGDAVDEYVDQVKTLYEKFDQLSDTEKGTLIGYAIGKYGVDIFAGGAVVKGVSTYRNLRNANRICNLEAMLLSSANKEAVIASSLKHAAERDTYFKNIRIHWDRQNKHIIGAHNYEADKYRSIFIHSDSEKLLKKFSGKGISKNNFPPGVPGYVERVDFGELIGYYIDKKNPKVKMPTTKGTIKYSKTGAHIVPSHPNG